MGTMTMRIMLTWTMSMRTGLMVTMLMGLMPMENMPVIIMALVMAKWGRGSLRMLDLWIIFDRRIIRTRNESILWPAYRISVFQRLMGVRWVSMLM